MCKVLMCDPAWNKVGGHGAYVSKTTAGEYVERMESHMSLVGIYCMICKSSNYPKEMRVCPPKSMYKNVHGACLKQDTNISSEDIEKGGQKECMSHTMGRSAMKCCLMVRTWLLVSRASVQHGALMYDLSNPIKTRVGQPPNWSSRCVC